MIAARFNVYGMQEHNKRHHPEITDAASDRENKKIKREEKMSALSEAASCGGPMDKFTARTVTSSMKALIDADVARWMV